MLLIALAVFFACEDHESALQADAYSKTLSKNFVRPPRISSRGGPALLKALRRSGLPNDPLPNRLGEYHQVDRLDGFRGAYLQLVLPVNVPDQSAEIQVRIQNAGGRFG
jgi:hypothetical protein